MEVTFTKGGREGGTRGEGAGKGEGEKYHYSAEGTLALLTFDATRADNSLSGKS